MYFPKCSIPGCSITTETLLTRIENDNELFFVCPQHMPFFGFFKRANIIMNFYNAESSLDSTKACELCESKKNLHAITTNGELSKTTVLCEEHTDTLFTGVINENYLEEIKTKHFELHLHFKRELSII